MANFKIKRGDDISIKLTYQDANGTALDLTGSTVFFTVKYEIDNDVTDANAIIKETVTVHTDPTNGITHIPISKSDTDNAAIGVYIGDVQIVDVSNDVSSSQTFPVEITADVTRRIL